MGKYSKEILNKIKTMGVMGYTTKKILNIMEPEDPVDFQNDLDDPESELAKAYEQGTDQRDFQIDYALWLKAKEGDTKALDKWEERNSFKDY